VRWCSVALALAVGAVPLVAHGNEPAERVAIQRRKYNLAHEVRLSLGVMPLDPYQKGWSGSVGYTLHLTDFVAWELLQVGGALLTSSSLREKLVNELGVPPEDFAAPRLFVTTGIELTPFYGKQTLLNRNIAHQALLFGLHAGVFFGDRGNLGDTFADPRPVVGAGLGYRFFLGELTSVRADVRYFLAFRRAVRPGESFELDDALMLNLSFSLNLWRDDA